MSPEEIASRQAAIVLQFGAEIRGHYLNGDRVLLGHTGFASGPASIARVPKVGHPKMPLGGLCRLAVDLKHPSLEADVAAVLERHAVCVITIEDAANVVLLGLDAEAFGGGSA